MAWPWIGWPHNHFGAGYSIMVLGLSVWGYNLSWSVWFVNLAACAMQIIARPEDDCAWNMIDSPCSCWFSYWYSSLSYRWDMGNQDIWFCLSMAAGINTARDTSHRKILGSNSDHIGMTSRLIWRARLNNYLAFTLLASISFQTSWKKLKSFVHSITRRYILLCAHPKRHKPRRHQ